MNTLNSFETSSSNLRGALSKVSQTSNVSDISKTSKSTTTDNSQPSVSKVEFTPTEQKQILSSLQRDLNPTNLPSNDMMKTLSELAKQTSNTTFSSVSNEIIPKSTPSDIQPIIVSTKNIQSDIVDFESMDENEILMPSYKDAPQKNNFSKNSIEEFLKTNNIDESTMFSDSDLFG